MTTKHPIPPELCGYHGCAYLPKHDGQHSWEVPL